MRIPVPQSFHCDISADGADVVLLLADMAPAVQGDQIAGCTEQEAKLAVEALAGLHGPSWCDPEWMDLAAIAMPKPGDDDAAKGLGDISKMAADIVIDRLGQQISAEDQETLVAAMSSVTPWLKAEPKRFALMHGDYRLDNMLFDPDRTRITVVDWQTVGIGLPGRDLAYFTGDQPGTGVAVRRRARSRRARITGRYWVTASRITTSTPAGATTASARCRCRCWLRWAPRSRRRPSAATT